MKSTKSIIVSIGLVLAAAPALASRQCSDYLGGVNKELASSMSSASKQQLTGLGIGPKGELLVGSPVGHFKLPHPWPGQIPPGRTGRL